MGRGVQLARQWRIIQTLISSKQGKSVADLVKEENCHPRTIYRDLEALQEAGFPIYQERRDGKGVWALVDEWKHHLPVFPFTLAEFMAEWAGGGLATAPLTRVDYPGGSVLDLGTGAKWDGLDPDAPAPAAGGEGPRLLRRHDRDERQPARLARRVGRRGAGLIASPTDGRYFR